MEFGIARAAADLLGRPRRPRRRPPQGGGRARRPARRRRPALPRRLLPAGRRRGRAARPRTTSAVDPEAVGLVREPVTVTVELAGETIEAAVWRKDVRRRRRRPALPARGRLAHRRALRRRPRAPDPPGAAARRRRRARARGARDRADRLPPERGALRVPADRAAARARSRRDARPTTRSSTCAARPSSRRTRRCRPGNEVFDEELVVRYVGDLAAAAGLDDEALLELGRFGDEPGFGMTPLALRLSAYANGVSELHGEVAREMWAPLWPGAGDADRPRHERRPPRHAGSIPRSASCCGTPASIPRRRPTRRTGRRRATASAEALWRVHAAAKARLAERAGIDRDRLTIGFARRFATYKRAGLVFSDLERLLALPVQIVVAGKAHPPTRRART